MLQHVYERTQRASRLASVWVATDDTRIMEAVAGFGGRAAMTSAEHATGSDRIAELAARPEMADAEIIVNVQGDQPLIDPDALDALVAALEKDSDAPMATLFEPLRRVEDLLDPNVAKVVGDRAGHALYFSRSPVPFRWDRKGAPRPDFHEDLGARAEGLKGYWKHVGVYAFRKDFLFEFGRLPRGPLEEMEGLEQLRVLEAGRSIRLVPAAGVSISVETPQDLERVQAIMNS